MSFERAARIADAVLLEGYVLYPYRASSTKNQYRWTFGVLVPQHWSEAHVGEPWWLETQLLVCGTRPKLRARLRFLALVERRVRTVSAGRLQVVERLEVDDRVFLPWEEGEVCEVDFEIEDGLEMPFTIDAEERIEIVRDAGGLTRGHVVRRREALSGAVHARLERIEHPEGEEPLWRLSLCVLNLTPWTDERASRAAVMRAAFASTHLLAVAEGARFVSLLDPPPHAAAAAAACTSVGCWPVLAGAEGADDVVLAAPIVLYDHPQIAPESTGDFFDATEIDELLALRTRALTPEEKELARATDPRAAAIVDRAESMTGAELARLHGAVRDPAGRPLLRLRPGSRVRLRLDRGTRRTDVQDLLYSGRSATVRAVKVDVDGREYLAVTIDDDPAAELHRAKGRFHYYRLDEVEPLDDSEAP